MSERIYERTTAIFKFDIPNIQVFCPFAHFYLAPFSPQKGPPNEDNQNKRMANDTALLEMRLLLRSRKPLPSSALWPRISLRSSFSIMYISRRENREEERSAATERRTDLRSRRRKKRKRRGHQSQKRDIYCFDFEFGF